MKSRGRFWGRPRTLALAVLASSLLCLSHSASAQLSLPNVVLGRPTTSSVTVNALADTNLIAYIDYGTQSTVYSSQTSVTNLTAVQPAEVDLTGLQPDTRYYYRLNYKLAGDPSYQTTPEYTFHTQRAPGSTFTFCMHGDTHPERAGNMFNADLYTNTLTHAAADQPDFYVVIGDDFSVDNIASDLISQALVTERYAIQRLWLGLVGNSASLFLVNGNHEQASLANYISTNLVAPGVTTVTLSNIAVWAQTARNKYYSQPALDAFFPGMTNDVLPGIGQLRSCYAWTWGDALFVTLDPYWYSTNAVDNQYGYDQHPTTDTWLITHGDAQYQWFKQTLEQSTAKYKFVFAHHVMGGGRGGITNAPYYEWGGKNKDGTWGFTTQRPSWPMPIHQLMVTNHVTMFVQGHDHIFVREELDGVTYLTLPIPGDDGYHLYNATAYPNAIYKTNNTGYVRFTVSPAQVQVDYVRCFLTDQPPDQISGMVDYSFTLSSSSNQPPVITGLTNTTATAGSPVWITATVTDNVGVESVTLHYSTGAGSILTNTILLETMATNSAKPWTGTGCDNAWTVTYTGTNCFEQRGQANYGAGNTNGLEFKKGTVNLTDSSITTSNPIDARGNSGTVSFAVWAGVLSTNAGWGMQLDPGTGFTTRLSELTGSNHVYQVYNYSLQPADLVSNLTMRFQFQGSNSNDRIQLDQISLQVVTGGGSWTNVAMTLVSNGVYTAQIPAQDAGTTVSYYVTASDNSGLTATNPVTGAALSLVVGSGTITPSYDVLLGRPTDSSIAISVMPTTNRQVYCEYGTQSGNYPNQIAATNLTSGTPAVLTLDSLLADTQYYYRLRYCESGQTNYSADAEHSFHTQRATTNSFTFIVEADPHYQDNQPPVWQLALTNMLADNPDFLIDLGDTFMGEKYYKTNSYTLSQAGIYEACKTVRSQFFSIAGPSIPLFLVNGNHDPELGWFLSNSQPTNNSAVWGAQAREYYYPCPIPGGFYSGSTNTDSYFPGVRDGYYAFEWGNTLFVMLDNFWYSWQGTNKSQDPWGWTLGTNQYQWLKQTLETSQATFKFVFAHHLVGGQPGNMEARGGLECAPYFEWGGHNTNGTWGFTENRPGWPIPIESLLLSNGVNAFFHGHDHLFVKQDLDTTGDGKPELIYQECPQPSRTNYNSVGGAALYGYTNGVIQGNSGYLRVQVTPTNATVDYVRIYLPGDEGAGKTNRMVTYNYTITPQATAPAANFIATPTSGGAPLSVTFTDTSTGTITNRSWDFGDGATTNLTGTSLTHTYNFPGSNTVSLTVSGSAGSSTTNQLIIATSVDTVGDGIPDWWRARYFGGDGTTTNASSCATCDLTGTGQNNLFKYSADLNPTNPASRLAITTITAITNDVELTWIGGVDAWQYLECSPNLASNQWSDIFTNAPPTTITNTALHAGTAAKSNLFYRIRARR
jgi:PKD repeat protein/phosphodiesterase/alkaline phosphatase D-like protein